MATGDLPAADLARYRELISGTELRDEDKDQVIRIVANIMKAFVDIAFQINPVRNQSIDHSNNSSHAESCYDSIEYIQTMQSEFAAATQPASDSVNAKDVRNGPAVAEESRHLLPR